ncbi:phospholipase D-like domain-containing protein [Geoglobus sp.]
MIDLLMVLKTVGLKFEIVASAILLKKLKGETILLSEILEILPSPKIDVNDVQELMNALEKAGIVERLDSEEYRIVKNPFTIYPHLKLIEETIPDMSLNITELVCSIPENLRPRGPVVLKSDLPWKYMKLLINSRESLKIVNPFFSEEITKILEDILPGKARDGVEIEIFTRGISDTGSNFNHISRLVKKMTEDGGIQNLRIFEFCEEFGFLHAKVLLRDGIQAYIGSANLTTASFKKSLEVGVLVKGDVAKELDKLINNLKKTAFRRVSLKTFLK